MLKSGWDPKCACRIHHIRIWTWMGKLRSMSVKHRKSLLELDCYVSQEKQKNISDGCKYGCAMSGTTYTFRGLSLFKQHTYHSSHECLELGVCSPPRKAEHLVLPAHCYDKSWAEWAEESNIQHKDGMIWRSDIGKMDNGGGNTQSGCLHFCDKTHCCISTCLMKKHYHHLSSLCSSLRILLQNFGCLPCISRDKLETG